MKHLNRFLEAHFLSPILRAQELDAFLVELKKGKLVSCVIPPFWVKKVARDLKDQEMLLSAAIAFPFGFQDTASKVHEAKGAIEQGVNEIDFVWSQTAYHSGMNWPKIEIAQLSKLCHDKEITLKVILETAHLDSNQLIEACHICQDAGADFVKTSTGCAGIGASVEQIEIMRNVLSSSVGIIASGAFFTLEEAIALIQAGADRVASANPVAILQEWQQLPS